MGPIKKIFKDDTAIAGTPKEMIVVLAILTAVSLVAIGTIQTANVEFDSASSDAYEKNMQISDKLITETGADANNDNDWEDIIQDSEDLERELKVLGFSREPVLLSLVYDQDQSKYILRYTRSAMLPEDQGWITDNTADGFQMGPIIGDITGRLLGYDVMTPTYDASQQGAGQSGIGGSSSIFIGGSSGQDSEQDVADLTDHDETPEYGDGDGTGALPAGADSANVHVPTGGTISSFSALDSGSDTWNFQGYVNNYYGLNAPIDFVEIANLGTNSPGLDSNKVLTLDTIISNAADPDAVYEVLYEKLGYGNDIGEHKIYYKLIDSETEAVLLEFGNQPTINSETISSQSRICTLFNEGAGIDEDIVSICIETIVVYK